MTGTSGTGLPDAGAPVVDELALRRAIGEVDAFFDGIRAPLEAWLPELIELLRERLADGRLTGAQLASLTESGAARVRDTIDRPSYGAGYCASELVVSEGNPLAWWQGLERNLLASSTFGPGQAAIDLARLEWYRVPEATGEFHVAGPFVDYLCSNEITITTSMPVLVDGEFWGVICADVLISSIEEALLPALGAIPNATIVNAGGRVVLSTDPDLETGDRTELDPDGAIAGVRAVSKRYPFAVAAG